MHISDKPSEALRQAVNDLEKCEQDERFEIDMNNWAKMVCGVCQVCLAGAMLVQQCGIPDEGLEFHNLPDDIAGKMWGIDAFRVGRLWDGVAWFKEGGYSIASGAQRGDRVEGLPEYVDVQGYHYSPVVFKEQMRGIADKLEKAGW